ncbi:MAG: CoA-binding protein [Candidatus Heimdallarchaeum aukensis]|uniref:CoA-binding protein n=1 Tax=Candidatus Heimdallarchaeum aukensis TaxID=2876573 RepID=A0A9Y1BLW3_9ARCH|nr:MAG: CoA-binding protein [Candidatus Heimdallarchaeum aukensis]
MTRKFFYPDSIAIIGATDNEKKFGHAVTANLMENKDLKAKLCPVHPKAETIGGLKAYKSVLEIPDEIDLAILLVPAKIVPHVVDECIEKKVKRIIIVTAGFAEINEEGRKVQEQLSQKLKDAGIRLIGPNCVGIQNVDIGMNASFIQTPPKGNVSMITQSGSVGAIVLYEMVWQGLGFSKFANLGNMADINLTDVLRFYKEDENTKVVTIYLENVVDGRVFYEELHEVAKDKPVVVLKGGRTATGMGAASSHTGSMATDYSSLKTAVKQAGAIMCESITDYIAAIKAFSFLPLPKGEKIGVLTNSGGSAVMFSDFADDFGLKLATFTEEFKEKIDPFLIPLVKKVNPLDMIAGATGKEYYEVTKAMLEDPNIDIVVPIAVIPTFLGMTTSEHYEGVIRAWNETGRKKPIIPIFMSGNLLNESKRIAKKESSPIFLNPREAAYAIKMLIQYAKRKKVIE